MYAISSATTHDKFHTFCVGKKMVKLVGVMIFFFICFIREKLSIMKPLWDCGLVLIIWGCVCVCVPLELCDVISRELTPRPYGWLPAALIQSQPALPVTHTHIHTQRALAGRNAFIWIHADIHAHLHSIIVMHIGLVHTCKCTHTAV